MKETILYYHIPTSVKEFLKQLQKELAIDVLEIPDNQLHQKMGYLLGVEEFTSSPSFPYNKPSLPLLYFAYMNNQQLDMVLSMLRQANIPHIPYKAVMTKTNLHFTFIELYEEIKSEHQAMTNNK